MKVLPFPVKTRPVGMGGGQALLGNIRVSLEPCSDYTLVSASGGCCAGAPESGHLPQEGQLPESHGRGKKRDSTVWEDESATEGTTGVRRGSTSVQGRPDRLLERDSCAGFYRLSRSFPHRKRERLSRWTDYRFRSTNLCYMF